MKENFKEIIKKGKWLSNTLLTILLIAIIVSIVIALNIFLDKTNISDIDLTKEKLLVAFIFIIHRKRLQKSCKNDKINNKSIKKIGKKI